MNNIIRNILHYSLILLLSIYFIVGCQKTDTQKISAVDNNEIQSSITVTGTTTKLSTISQKIQTTAALYAHQKSIITAELSTRVKEVLVVEGEYVTAVRNLIILDQELYKIDLIKARGNFFKAISELISELRLTDSSSLSEWEEYQNKSIQEEFLPTLPISSSPRVKMVAVRFNIHNHFSDVKKIEQQIRACTIVAPFRGIVSGIRVLPSTAVSPGSEMLTLTDLTRMRVEIDILESDMSFIKPGSIFEFYNEPSKSYTISAIHPEINTDSKTGKAIAFIPNPSFKYKDGQRVMVNVIKQTFSGRLVIPRSAILNRNDRDLVFIVKNGVAKWQYIETGVGNVNQTEIIEGLAVGDTIITEGHYSLGHDTPVLVKVKP